MTADLLAVLREAREALRSCAWSTELRTDDALMAMATADAKIGEATMMLTVSALRALLTRPVAQGEAVAWQYRIAMRSGQWAWSMWFDPITDKSEFDAVIQCQRDAGNEVETRQLYDHPAPEREGWKLVPVTPTTAMLNAGSDSHEYGAHRLCAQMWKDMLAAAPTTGSAGE